MEELDALVTQARGVESATELAASEEARDAAAAARREIVLRKMHAWLSAWGDIARSVITRRDELIRLGIAKRRARKEKAKPRVAALQNEEGVAPPSRAA